MSPMMISDVDLGMLQNVGKKKDLSLLFVAKSEYNFTKSKRHRR
jgi:hypothetical protein